MSTTNPQRFPLIAGGFFGATGVALGALGAHRLQPLLDQHGMAHAWETGAKYHIFHAIALLGLAALTGQVAPAAARWLAWAAWCWTIGIVLFAGSLYWLALLGPRPYPIVFATPLGGVALLAGWVGVIAAGLGLRSSRKDGPG